MFLADIVFDYFQPNTQVKIIVNLTLVGGSKTDLLPDERENRTRSPR